jgi:tRNA A37 threonylcarbamoyladenosine dehydratase
MSERIKAINPDCKVHAIREYFSTDNAQELITKSFQGVIDAIDVLTPKCHLLAACKRLRIPVIAMGAAGGMMDPTLIKITDLNKSYQDPLLAQVRKKLKREYNFSTRENARFKIPCVFSSEHKTIPQPEELDCGLADTTGSKNLGCDYGYGSATFVTGSMAFFAVGHLFKMLLRKP